MKFIEVEISEPIFIPTSRAGDGEAATTQVFPVLLSSASLETREHFVICAYFPFLDQSRRESVASQLRAGGAGGACAFIVHDAEGEATVVTDNAEDSVSAFEAAAAVAVVKASCGWDESEPIIVRVDDTELSAVARFAVGKWVVSVSEAG